MSEPGGVSIRKLLPGRFDQMDGRLKDELSKDSELSTRKLAWGFIGSEATDAIQNVLDCDVFTILAHGWCIARELLEYTDTTKHPIGETSALQLGKHKVTTSVHPVLVITIAPAMEQTLRFTLELAAEFRLASIVIRNGHIRRIESGECDVSAQLKYGDLPLHDPKTTRSVKLPGRLDLGTPGLAIG